MGQTGCGANPCNSMPIAIESTFRDPVASRTPAQQQLVAAAMQNPMPGFGGGVGSIPMGGYGATAGTVSPPTVNFPTEQDPYGLGSAASEIPTTTASANLAAAGYNVQLADIINATNRAAQQAANAARLGPQGQQIQGNLLANAERESAGLLDPQTEQMLQASIAARGIGSGQGVDSPALAAAYTRALGTNINALEQQGLQNYTSLLAANPAAPIYNMGDLLTTPGTIASAAANQAAIQSRERQFLAELAAQTERANAARIGSLPATATASSPGSRSVAPTVAPAAALQTRSSTLSPFTAGGGGGIAADAAAIDNWQWDSGLGAYRDTQTGSIADTPGGSPWEGFSWEGVNTPAWDESTVSPTWPGWEDSNIDWEGFDWTAYNEPTDISEGATYPYAPTYDPTLDPEYDPFALYGEGESE